MERLGEGPHHVGARKSHIVQGTIVPFRELAHVATVGHEPGAPLGAAKHSLHDATGDAEPMKADRELVPFLAHGDLLWLRGDSKRRSFHR